MLFFDKTEETAALNQCRKVLNPLVDTGRVHGCPSRIFCHPCYELLARFAGFGSFFFQHQLPVALLENDQKLELHHLSLLPSQI